MDPARLKQTLKGRSLLIIYSYLTNKELICSIGLLSKRERNSIVGSYIASAHRSLRFSLAL